MHASRAIDDPWPLGAWEGVKRRPLRSLESRGHWITLLWEIQECKNLHSLKRSQQVKPPENGWLEDESPFGMVYFQGQTCC